MERTMTHLFSSVEIGQWLDNDEGLYNWWQASKLSKRDFIHQNRKELDNIINLMNSGQKQMHYLAYGPEAKYK